MTCAMLEGELVDFHFGAVDADRRDAIEAHLCACAACVRELLAVKRAIETAELAAEPSAAAHARLRSAVAALTVRRRWHRPLALAFALGALAASLAASHALVG